MVVLNGMRCADWRPLLLRTIFSQKDMTANVRVSMLSAYNSLAFVFWQGIQALEAGLAKLLL